MFSNFTENWKNTENNSELQLAWQFTENTGTHLFLTGEVGTGKTTFLRRLKGHTSRHMVTLVPTGIVAISVGGITIHSLFQLSFAPFMPEIAFNSSQTYYRYSKEKRSIIRSMDLLAVDEVSTVRVDLLDTVDAVLQRYRNKEKPFGGVQLLMIGDLRRLASVMRDDERELSGKHYETPYFFASHAPKETAYMTTELKKVYRQNDTFFLSLLNKIRENKTDDEVLNELNRRYQPGLQPQKEGGYIRLTTHNNQAQRVSDRELASLPDKAYHFSIEIEGDFPEYSYPADRPLAVKKGAQIVSLKNDLSSEKRHYSGTADEVATVNETGIVVCGKGNRSEFQLSPEGWGNYRYVLNEGTKEITEVVEGTFRQYPIHLTWAVMIRKSQGLTFEYAIIDTRNSFVHGQAYVVLSRRRTLEGMVLESPLRGEAIIGDTMVDDFIRAVEQNKPGGRQSSDMQKAYFSDLLSDLFNSYPTGRTYKRSLCLMDEDLYRFFPKQLAEHKALAPHVKEKVVEASQHFRNQYTRLVHESEGYAVNEELQERIRSSAGYLHKKLEPVRTLYNRTNMSLDDKGLRKPLAERIQTLGDALWTKESLLEAVSTRRGLVITDYLELKAKVILSLEDDSTSSSSLKALKEKEECKERKEHTRSAKKVKVEVPTDTLYPEFYHTLSERRTAKTREVNAPAHVIMQQEVLMGIVNLLSNSPRALEATPYFRAKGVEKYGLEILDIVRKYVVENQLGRPEIMDLLISSGNSDGTARQRKTELQKETERQEGEAKKEKKKETKKDMKLVSYGIFRQGMSIDEIVKACNLVSGAIAGHLEHCVRSGEIKAKQVVRTENIAKIRKYLDEHEYMGVFIIKVALGDAASYTNIEFALVVSGH